MSSTSPADKLKIAMSEALAPLMKDYTDKILAEMRGQDQTIKIDEVARMATVNELVVNVLEPMKQQILARIDGDFTALSEKLDGLDKKITILSLKIEGSRRDNRNSSTTSPMNAFARSSGDLPSNFNCD